jgi:hypothetical protein
MVSCTNGGVHDCDAAILTLPLPLLKEIVLPPEQRGMADYGANLLASVLSSAGK